MVVRTHKHPSLVVLNPIASLTRHLLLTLIRGDLLLPLVIVSKLTPKQTYDYTSHTPRIAQKPQTCGQQASLRTVPQITQ